MIEHIEGDRVVLRKGRPDDLDAMWHNVWTDHSIEKNVLWKVVSSREEAEERLKSQIEAQKSFPGFYVCLKDTDEAIGFAAVREVPDEEGGLPSGIYEDAGLGFAAAYQGKGLGKEVLGLLMKLVFEELKGQKFYYGCFTENVRSASLCKSMGFHYVCSKGGTRKWDGYEYVSDYHLLTSKEYFSIKG